MSRSPSGYLSNLSLQNGPSPLGLNSPMQSLQRSPMAHSSDQYSDQDESDWEDVDDARDLVISPSGLRYTIAHLPPRSQKMMRGLCSTQDPPRIFLELCGIKQEGGDGDGFFYAFQLQEMVPCSVRFGSRESTKFSMPQCECPDSRYRKLRPCKHIVWLFDQVSKQVLFNHELDTTLSISELGYPKELGDPFTQVSNLRLDILADALRCNTTALGSSDAAPSRSRLREAREMVAAAAGISAQEVDRFRLDLEEKRPDDFLVHRGDLEATLFSLLLAFQPLAARVRTELDPTDPAVDPFRALQGRAMRIVSELDSYSSSLQDRALRQIRGAEGKEAEGPRNVKWAAAQLCHCVAQVESLVSHSAAALAGSSRASAARALVGILKTVAAHNRDSHSGETVVDRNLYMCLIGNQDKGFVYTALDKLADQSQFVEELESVMELVGRFGAPQSYVSNLRGLIKRMRSHTAEDSRRSSVAGLSSSTPRNGTPPLEGVPPPDHRAEPYVGPGEPSSAGRNVQFLIPGAAESTRARGGRRGAASGSETGESSRAGSKRPMPGTGSERGKGPKRPR